MTAIQIERMRRHARSHAPRDRFNHAIRRGLVTLREWRRRSRERYQIAALDDRMLKDIGISRADAEFLSDKPFWRA